MSHKQPNLQSGKRETQTKVSRRKKIIKIREEINQIETKKKEKIEKINETKCCFFEKLNKIDKPLAKLINRKRERI